jgi:hypothetical protein
LTAAGGHFPITRDKDGPDHLLIRGALSGNLKQLLGGVSEDIICFPKKSWEPRTACVAFDRLWPQSLLTEAVSTPVQAMRMAFGLCMHVPPVGLMTCLVLYALARVPWWALD